MIGAGAPMSVTSCTRIASQSEHPRRERRATVHPPIPVFQAPSIFRPSVDSSIAHYSECVFREYRLVLAAGNVEFPPDITSVVGISTRIPRPDTLRVVRQSDRVLALQVYPETVVRGRGLVFHSVLRPERGERNVNRERAKPIRERFDAIECAGQCDEARMGARTAGTRDCGSRSVGGLYGRSIVGNGDRTGTAADSLHERGRDV